MNETRTVLAIDPGNISSALVVYDGEQVKRYYSVPNTAMFSVLCDEWNRAPIRLHNDDPPRPALVIEQVASMGMAVGEDVFETVFWSGRLAQAWRELGGQFDRVKRHEVKMHLCGNMRAKDANIRQALIDKFGPGKEKAIGRKAAPGPLYGLGGDCWSALAVAVTWLDRQRTPSRQAV